MRRSRRRAACQIDEVGDAVAPAKRYDAWRALSLAGGASAERVGRAPAAGFDGRVRRVIGGGGGRFADISTPSLRVRRPYDVSPDGNGPDLQLTLVLDG